MKVKKKAVPVKKEGILEKSEGSVEAVRDNEIVEVAVEQKSIPVHHTSTEIEEQGEEQLEEANEPKFIEEKQYITTDNDDVNDVNLDDENYKDASTEKHKESEVKADQKPTTEQNEGGLIS